MAGRGAPPPSLNSTGRRRRPRPQRGALLLLTCLVVGAATAVAAAAEEEGAPPAFPPIVPLATDKVCDTCAGGQGQAPSAEAIQGALAYNADRTEYGLPDLGEASLQHMLLMQQADDEALLPLVDGQEQRRLDGGEREGDAWEGEGGGLPMDRHRRQLLHVSTAESTMLQNALMWKVNQEFAQAQQKLDEIRESNQLKPRAKDNKPHLGDGTYAKKIAQYIQKGKKLRGNSNNSTTTAGGTNSTASNSTIPSTTTNTTTPLPSPANNYTAPSTTNGTHSPNNNTAPGGGGKPPAPGQNRYGGMGQVAHGGTGSGGSGATQQQLPATPPSTPPQPSKPPTTPTTTNTNTNTNGGGNSGLGTNAMEIEIPAVVPGFTPDVTLAIPDPQTIGSGGVLNAMPKLGGGVGINKVLPASMQAPPHPQEEEEEERQREKSVEEGAGRIEA